MIGIGLGLSPWMLLPVGLPSSSPTWCSRSTPISRPTRSACFTLGYGRLGPTEARLGLIALNTLIALGVGLGFHVGELGLTVLDLVGLGIAGAMVVGLVARAAQNLRRLAEQEPAGGASA